MQNYFQSIQLIQLTEIHSNRGTKFLYFKKLKFFYFLNPIFSSLRPLLFSPSSYQIKNYKWQTWAANWISSIPHALKHTLPEKISVTIWGKEGLSKCAAISAPEILDDGINKFLNPFKVRDTSENNCGTLISFGIPASLDISSDICFSVA